MEIVRHVKLFVVKHLIVEIINVLVNVIVVNVIHVHIKLMLHVHVDKHQSLFHVVVKNKQENHGVINYVCKSKSVVLFREDGTSSKYKYWFEYFLLNKKRIYSLIENHRIVIIKNVNHIYVILMNVQIVNNNVIYH